MALAGCVATALASPLTAWWLIGDLSYKGRPRDRLDYAYRAPRVSAFAHGRGVGAATLVLVATVAAALAVAVLRRKLDWKWLRAACFLIAAGALLAMVGRVMTAGVVGANIGAGLYMFFGLPCVVGLVVLAGRDICSRFAAPYGTQ